MMKHYIYLLYVIGFLTMVPAVDSSAASEQLQAPERGFISSEPAETWEQGLITGNGTIGANVLSRPLDETIIFTHERMFLPKGPPLMPPITLRDRPSSGAVRSTKVALLLVRRT